MKTRILLMTLLFVSNFAFSQNTMILFFKDKPTDIGQNIESNFSNRSIERRVLNNVEFDAYDAPVNQDYLSDLALNGDILNVSRWLNAVSFRTFHSVETIRNGYPFVSRIQVIEKSTESTINKFEAVEKSLNYGEAFAQINQLNLDCLHDQGYTGTGIYIGILDAGFSNMDNIEYFDSLYLENRVLDMHNFVTGTSQVYQMSSHGTSVSSCIVAEKASPDEYAGTAIDADLALYISEDVGSETELEEFNLVSALERCDSVGVNVVNISLGYFGFDDTTTSHVYADLDGETTVAAVGVNVASTKGIIVVTSAGNSGPGKISTPCDADSCLCVGAIDVFGTLAGFSSIGPSADGQIKPDIVATGKDTWLISSGGNLQTGNGTSFSSPITAGAVACLVQANPTKTASEIRNAIRQSAHQFATPDSLMGYGIPDFCAAHDILNPDVTAIDEFDQIGMNIYPIPTTDYFIIEMKNKTTDQLGVQLINSLGQVVIDSPIFSEKSQFVLDVRNISDGIYSIRVSSEATVDIVKRVVIRR